MNLNGVVDIRCPVEKNRYKLAFEISSWLTSQGLELGTDFKWGAPLTLPVSYKGQEEKFLRFKFQDPKWATLVALKYS